jgi:hypothetical protein
MDSPLNVKNGQSILKQFYGPKPKKEPGPISQMNQNSPMMAALRQKRDMIAKTDAMQSPSANKIMHAPGKPMVGQKKNVQLPLNPVPIKKLY